MESLDRCPVCHGEGRIHFISITHGGYQLEYLACKSCAAVYQSPRMTAEELAGFYTEGYREFYQQTEAPTKKDLVMQETRAARTLELVRRDLPAVQRHLDIGSSSGALLESFRQAYGCVSIGVEPGDVYRKFSQSIGIETFPSLERLLENKPGTFDLASMMHVIEHLPDPRTTLSSLRQNLLSPGAHLLVEVPNLYEHEAFELAHLFAFTPASLERLLRLAGFDIVWVRAHGSFRSPILKLFVTALARVPEAQIDPPRLRSFPRLIKARRWLGQTKRKLFTRLLPDWTWQAPRTLWGEED
jgi:SAM-dependent methyltransferase